VRILAFCFAILAGLGLAARATAVDGVIEIHQAAVAQGGITPGDAPGFPVTLSRPGSYRLTSSLSSSSRGTVYVAIASAGVVLDLNGFAIGCFEGASCAASASGQGISGASWDDVTIRNGTVTGVGSSCITLGARATIASLHVTSCGLHGISVGARSRILDTTVAGCDGNGIVAGAGSLVRDSVVADNGGYGLSFTFESSLVLHSVITANNGAILAVASGAARASGYRECVITLNNGTIEDQRIESSAGGQILNLGNNVCGNDTVCP